MKRFWKKLVLLSSAIVLPIAIVSCDALNLLWLGLLLDENLFF
jgi:hypothetical protein